MSGLCKGSILRSAQELNRRIRSLVGMNRKPDWLRVRPLVGEQFARTNAVLKKHRLGTVCQSANCPNRSECFARGTATFLILGPTCTRNCHFCDIRPGHPHPVDSSEPARVAMAARDLNLDYVVVTSVTRDDLPDGGAGHFADVIRELRRHLPNRKVEVLTPDFAGVPDALSIIMKARPDVFNHNVETVPRLYAKVRPGAEYSRSLLLLKRARREFGALTKSGVMVGLGETDEELDGVFADLAKHEVCVLTIGQYLAPSVEHLPVERYVPPEQFDRFAEAAKKAGIAKVIAGPLIRSSYRADDLCTVLDTFS